MALIDRSTLIAELGRATDGLLATQLVDEYISLERRFILRDWEPAELDGGQFCEIGARIVYGADSGNIALTKSMSDCLHYVANEQVHHAIQPRHDSLHLSKVLKCVYKFRSQRGAVHISPTYGPNEMDARFIVEGVRWLFAEILRILWTGDRELVAKAIRELLQFDTPAIGRFGNRLLVQRTDVRADEEILILLHYAGEAGMHRLEIGRNAEFDSAHISRSIKRLCSREVRQVIKLPGEMYRLTDVGSKRIREELVDKLRIE